VGSLILLFEWWVFGDTSEQIRNKNSFHASSFLLCRIRETDGKKQSKNIINYEI